jgi:hypothetical protein
MAERGAKITLPLPDGSTLEVRTDSATKSWEGEGGSGSKEGGVVRTGDVRRIRGRRMPVKGGPERGDVVIQFTVRWRAAVGKEESVSMTNRLVVMDDE